MILQPVELTVVGADVVFEEDLLGVAEALGVVDAMAGVVLEAFVVVKGVVLEVLVGVEGAAGVVETALFLAHAVAAVTVEVLVTSCIGTNEEQNAEALSAIRTAWQACCRCS